MTDPITNLNRLMQQLKPHQTEIISFEAGDPDENPWVQSSPEIVKDLQVVPFDPKWLQTFSIWENRIQQALGEKALSISHVGSTAVPGLAAKPIIDMDLIVKDPSHEADYIPALEALGFKLTIREPSWYQHRMLKHRTPEINLHVFAPNCPEHLRHLLFRDWLKAYPEDCEQYAAAKNLALNGAITTEIYNQQKSAVVKAIYDKIFTALQNI